MTTLPNKSDTNWVKRHPVLAYYIGAFALSWGIIMLVIGPAAFFGVETIPGGATAPLVYLAMLIGPSLAGLTLTGLVRGRAGYVELLSHLKRWQVGLRWYAVALLTVPIFTAVTLLALSLVSRTPGDFLPAIVTSSAKTSLIVSGIIAGLAVGFFEELGWTGFVLPELRKHYGVLTAGSFMGLLWGAWHFPLFSGSASSSGEVPPVIYVIVLLFSFLPPYRVLLAWVYERTGSLLMVMLMHAPLVASQLILVPAALTGAQLVAFDAVLAAALWATVAVVGAVGGGKRSRAEHVKSVDAVPEVIDVPEPVAPL